MAVQSVNGGTNSATASLQAAEAQRSQQARQAEQREPKREESAEKKEETAKPVVNAQGQTTGTLINITA